MVLSFGPSPKKTGPYSLETFIAIDNITGKKAILSEKGRYEHTLVIGPTASGKTTLYFEPMIARDIEKKAFFRDSAKTLGYSLLRAGIARIKPEYLNSNLNENFNLNMIEPVKGRDKVFNLYLNRVKKSQDPDNMEIKDIGVIYFAPEIESIYKIVDVAKNYKVDYKVVDPMDKDAYGVNPFLGNNYDSIALAISSMISTMKKQQAGSSLLREDFEESRALENIIILLKVMYQKKYPSVLPTLEDLYKLLSNFDLIQALAEELKSDPDLLKEHQMRINYIENNFYRDCPNREKMTEVVRTPVAILETFLTNKHIKNVFCNRTKNIDFTESTTNR